MSKRKPFSELTDAGKRARVARDVLVQLDSHRLTAGAGYGRIKRCHTADDEVTYNDGHDLTALDLRDLITSAYDCEACALGCMFMADVISRDRMPASRGIEMQSTMSLSVGERQYWINDDEMRARLQKFFGKAQLAMIESAYETVDMRPENDAEFVNYELIRRAISFGTEASQLKGDKRMRAIMNNIIAHRGNFVLEPLAKEGHER